MFVVFCHGLPIRVVIFVAVVAFLDKFPNAHSCVVVPDENGHVSLPPSMTRIEDNGFHSCTDLKSITLTDNIISIGNDSFYGCTSLSAIIIPDSVMTVGARAFQQCTSIASITIGNSVTNINQGAFRDCHSLLSVSIPTTVSHIGIEAFQNCTMLGSVEIPDSVQRLSRSLFYNCNSLESIRVPDSVVSIGHQAFQNCSILENVTIPNSVTKIGDDSFAACLRIQYVTLSNQLQHIGHASFSECISLRTLVIPDSVRTLGLAVFSGCKQLSNVVLSSALESIPFATFRRCFSLTSVNIPDGVTFLGSQSFAFCTALDSVHLPNSVIVLADAVFQNCTNLSSIVVPASVVSIGDYAFAYCTHLNSVFFQYGIRILGEYAFKHCTRLASILVPGSVASVGEGAFRYCSNLHTVHIQSNTTLIGRDAFASCACAQGFYLPAEPLCGCIFCADTTTVAPTSTPSIAPTPDPFIQLQSNLRCDPSVLEDRAPRFALGGGGHTIDECRAACLAQGPVACSALVLTATGFCHMFTECSYMYDLTSATLLLSTAAPSLAPTMTPTSAPSVSPTDTPTAITVSPTVSLTEMPSAVPVSELGIVPVDETHQFSHEPTSAMLLTRAPTADTSLSNTGEGSSTPVHTLLLVVAAAACVFVSCMTGAVLLSRRHGRLHLCLTATKTNHRGSDSPKDITTNPVFADNKYYSIDYDCVQGGSPTVSQKQSYYSSFGGSMHNGYSTAGSMSRQHLYEYHLSVNEDVSVRDSTLYAQQAEDTMYAPQQSKFYSVNATRQITMREPPDDVPSTHSADGSHCYEVPVALPTGTNDGDSRAIAWYNNTDASDDNQSGRGRERVRSAGSPGMPSPSPVRITRGRVLNGNPTNTASGHGGAVAEPNSELDAALVQPQRLSSESANAKYDELIKAVSSHPQSSAVDVTSTYDLFVSNMQASTCDCPGAPYDQIAVKKTPSDSERVQYDPFPAPTSAHGINPSDGPYYSSVVDEPKTQAYSVIESPDDADENASYSSETVQPDFYVAGLVALVPDGAVHRGTKNANSTCTRDGDSVAFLRVW
eukprot:m.1258646 g.1258646  ORF g.1258646 m.1258646 type:complete len:1058 (-) comp24720_c0_seq6:33-3206(-)